MLMVPVDKDRLRAELLAAARTAVEKLTDDQCEVIYLEIEQRLGLPAPHERADSPEKTRPVADLPFAEAKRRAVEDVERAYLTRLMEQAHGCVATAAELACMDRSNFRRRLQHVGLRAAGKKTPVSCMDQILQILDEHRAGLRACEIAKKICRTGPNTFKTLKLLERKNRVKSHGTRTHTLWTLPGVEPMQRSR